tara:strand:+ start:36 stop:167 length:132 start_codon:yes stop_codon:yes gene_type:complete
MKKRKLNSKNPKYQKEDKKQIKKTTKILICEAKNCKVYAVFEE